MKKNINNNEVNEEAGVKQLAKLIKLAGDEARKSTQRAMEQHFKKLNATINETISRCKTSTIK